MDENWYVVRLLIRDQIAEAQAAARTRALIRAASSPHRGWYALGVGLIRLGSWVLARGAEPPQRVARPLASLRAALKSS